MNVPFENAEPNVAGAGDTADTTGSKVGHALHTSSTDDNTSLAEQKPDRRRILLVEMNNTFCKPSSGPTAIWCSPGYV